MSLTQYDSLTISAIPANPQAVAGYVGGFWPNFSQLVAAFPRAKHLSIAVNAGEDADCLDIENGDAVPADAPGWYARQKARGLARPCFYADASTMPAVLLELGNAGVGRKEFRVWTAHYTDVAHQEPGADATQWTEHGLGRNLDISLCVDTFYDAAVAVVNPTHYEWFDGTTYTLDGRKLNERALVQKYDRLRKHGVLNRLRLVSVRSGLALLAGRVAREAQEHPEGNRANRRNWRRLQLLHRSQGQRFV